MKISVKMSLLTLNLPIDDSNKENDSPFSSPRFDFTEEQIKKFILNYIDFFNNMNKKELSSFFINDNIYEYIEEIITNDPSKYNFCFSIEKEFSKYIKNPFDTDNSVEFKRYYSMKNNLFYLIHKFIIKNRLKQVDEINSFENIDQCHLKKLNMYYLKF